MSTLSLLILYCLFIMLASLAGGWVPILLRLTHKRMEVAISLVAGFMLAVGLLHLLPEAVHQTSSIEGVLTSLLIGFLVMFFIERFFCFHHHDVPTKSGEDQPVHRDTANGSSGSHHHRLTWSGAAVGLTLHSMIAGVGLGAGILAEAQGDRDVTWKGLAMFVVIVLHKPFDSFTIGTLMTAGRWSPGFRHLVNAIFALAVPAGAVLVFLGLGENTGHDHAWIGHALAFATGTILCIATSDLLPELQFHQHDRVKLSAALLIGVALAWLVGQFHAHGHGEPAGRHPEPRQSAPEHDHAGHAHD